MKKLSIVLALIFASIYLVAQENSETIDSANVKVQEIGIAFSNFDNFGLTYKIGNEKSLWRFYTLYFSGDNSKRDRDYSTYITNKKDNNYGFGFKVGKEFRRIIVSNLEFRYGFDLMFDYSHEKSLIDYENYAIINSDSKTNTYSPGVDIVIGLNYVIKEKLVIGVEILPFFSYDTGKDSFINYSENSTFEQTTKISGYSYGLSNSSALLTLAYRF